MKKLAEQRSGATLPTIAWRLRLHADEREWG